MSKATGWAKTNKRMDKQSKRMNKVRGWTKQDNKQSKTVQGCKALLRNAAYSGKDGALFAWGVQLIQERMGHCSHEGCSLFRKGWGIVRMRGAAYSGKDRMQLIQERMGHYPHEGCSLFRKRWGIVRMKGVAWVQKLDWCQNRCRNECSRLQSWYRHEFAESRFLAFPNEGPRIVFTSEF